MRQDAGGKHQERLMARDHKYTLIYVDYDAPMGDGVRCGTVIQSKVGTKDQLTDALAEARRRHYPISELSALSQIMVDVTKNK